MPGKLRSLLKALAPDMPEAAQEYKEQLQLASDLSGHLMAMLSHNDDAYAGMDSWQQHSLEGGINSSWLPYLVASHHLIQGHGADAAAALASVSPTFGRPDCDPAKALPLDPGCGPLRIHRGGYLSDPSAAPLVHLARRLQQQQGQATGCESSISFSSSFGGLRGNSSSAAGELSGKVAG